MNNLATERSSIKRRVFARVAALLSLAGLVALVSWPAGADPVPVFVRKFSGTTLNDANTSFTFPPDTMGAKGPGAFAELLNSSFTVYSDLGAVKQRVDLNTFWDTAITNNVFPCPSPLCPFPPPIVNRPFDPRILFDPTANRWYAVSVDNPDSPNSTYLFAVTTGSDPALNNWRGFQIKADADGKQWADFPTLGYSSNGVYISANMFDLGANKASQVHLVGIPKASLTATTPSTNGIQGQEGLDVSFTFQPAIDPLGVTGNQGVAYKGFSVSPDGLSVQALDIPDSFLTGTKLGSSQVIVPPEQLFTPSPSAYPSGSGLQSIDSGELRVSSSVQLAPNGYWLAAGVNNPIIDRAAISWMQINTQGDSITQSGLLTHDALNFIYPSIAINAFDQVGIGASVMRASGPQAGAGPAGAVWGGITDANGHTTFNAGNFITDTVSNNTYQRIDPGDSLKRNRWGDYSATTLDPDNPLRFWTDQEYVAAKDTWGTYVTAFHVANPEQDCVPGVNCAYYSDGEQKYDFDILLDGFNLRGMFDLSNLPDELDVVGDSAVERFRLVVDATLHYGSETFILRNIVAELEELFTLTARDEFDRVFATELLNLDIDLSGLGLPFNAEIRLNPDRESLGEWVFTSMLGSDWILNSYLNLFTEASFDLDRDGRFDRTLASDRASHLFLRAAQVPEPSTLSLAALLGLVFLWRKRRQ